MVAIRTLLVDDSIAILDSVERYVTSLPGVEVVGRACSGQQAIQLVAQLRPDLVLIDVTMPGMNGLEATQQIKKFPDAPRVIVLSIHEQAEYRDAALSAQADAYIAKSDLKSGLVATLWNLFEARLRLFGL